MNPQIIKTFMAAAVVVAICWADGARAATLAEKCQAGKNKVAGKYAACRQSAEARLATTGDGAAHTTALGKCTTKYGAAWQKLEANSFGFCPRSDDEIPVRSMLTGCTSDAATAIGGGPINDCPGDLAGYITAFSQCTGDLAVSNADLTQCSSDLAACYGLPYAERLKTGQTTCYDAAGATIACAGTGQDGELQEGVPRSYTDNGDGTKTDNRTGLVWEKLSNDGSIHDKDDVYSWTDAFAVKIATLNSTTFAGHNDWRLPNRSELESLVDLGQDFPSLTGSSFNIGCTSGSCTATSPTCSCTEPDYYWSSTTYHGSPSAAWAVSFDDGWVAAWIKSSNAFSVRAVRGG